MAKVTHRTVLVEMSTEEFHLVKVALREALSTFKICDGNDRDIARNLLTDLEGI